MAKEIKALGGQWSVEQEENRQQTITCTCARLENESDSCDLTFNRAP